MGTTFMIVKLNGHFGEGYVIEILDPRNHDSNNNKNPHAYKRRTTIKQDQ